MYANLNIRILRLEVLAELYNDTAWMKQITNLRKYFEFYQNVNLIVCKTINEMEVILGVKLPKWVKGVSYDNTILLLRDASWIKSSNQFSQLIVHEFVHIVIDKMSITHCPIWLNEGLASYFAEQYTISDKDLNYNSTESLYDLDYTNPNLYDLGLQIVRKLIDAYGIECIISKIKSVTSYKNDEILGDDNIKMYL